MRGRKDKWVPRQHRPRVRRPDGCIYISKGAACARFAVGWPWALRISRQLVASASRLNVRTAAAPRGIESTSARAISRLLHRVCALDRARKFDRSGWAFRARERDPRSQPGARYDPRYCVPTRRWNVSRLPKPDGFCGAIRMKKGWPLLAPGTLAECKCQFARGTAMLRRAPLPRDERGLRIRDLGNFAQAQANQPASFAWGSASCACWRAEEHA